MGEDDVGGKFGVMEGGISPAQTADDRMPPGLQPDHESTSSTANVESSPLRKKERLSERVANESAYLGTTM